MIVSASYRTDIPAFYGPWFQARLAAGYCRVRNPYGSADFQVPLDPESVDGFVFWTRNVTPFAAALDAVRARRDPFVVQHTVTGYPRAIDAATPDSGAAVAAMRDIVRRDGHRTVVWRYDPVVFTDLTPAGWHRRNFAALASALSETVDEVVVSFAQIYRKTRRNLDGAAARHGFAWRDPAVDEKRALLADLTAIAGEQGMTLTLCGQPDLLAAGAAPARCIDAARLSDLAGRDIAATGRAHRKTCGCAPSRDIGAYDTCPHGCAYCYAVSDRDRAKARLAGHDPAAERL